VFGGMHALIDYYELTRDEALKEALLKTADVFCQEPLGSTQLWVVLFAARFSEEREKYVARLREFCTGRGFASVYDTVCANRQFWLGDHAYMQPTTLVTAFWVLNALPYLMPVLEQDPQLSEEQRRLLDQHQREGMQQVTGRGRW